MIKNASLLVSRQAHTHTHVHTLAGRSFHRTFPSVDLSCCITYVCATANGCRLEFVIPCGNTHISNSQIKQSCQSCDDGRQRRNLLRVRAPPDWPQKRNNTRNTQLCALHRIFFSTTRHGKGNNLARHTTKQAPSIAHKGRRINHPAGRWRQCVSDEPAIHREREITHLNICRFKIPAVLIKIKH